jgi:hypothetical protein
MEIHEAMNIIRKHQRWRLGDESIEATEPNVLTAAIDALIEWIEYTMPLFKGGDRKKTW